MTGFGERLARALGEFGPLCVGIDPHPRLLREWGLEDSAAGVREFGLRVIEVAAGRVGVVKPQVSFFERFGSAGFAALEEVLAAGRSAGLLMIADAKRGDIGSTMDGYAQAWLAPGSPLEADALTISPYLGPESLTETLAFALQHGKGAFVLAATSNPEASVIQAAVVSGATPDSFVERAQRDETRPSTGSGTGASTASGTGASTDPGTAPETVAARIAREVAVVNAGSPSSSGLLGSIGLVVGATVDRSTVGLSDDVLRGAPLLAPGFGAQGAVPADLPARFGALAPQVLAAESRSILSAGPDRLAAAIDARRAEYAEVRVG